MSNRGFRFVIASLALAAAAAAGFRIVQHEQRLDAAQTSFRSGDRAAESAVATLAELKAALHAYVAPGQSHDLWSSRATALLDRLRGALIQLEAAATQSGMTAADELNQADRLAAVEDRAERYARASQTLIASEVIFTEGRDLFDALHLQVVRTREELGQRAEQYRAQVRREQTLLGLGAAAVMTLAILVLVPIGRALTEPSRESRALETPTEPVRSRLPAGVDPTADALDTFRPVRSPRAQVRSTDATPSPPPPGSTSVVSLADPASVCTDLGLVSLSNEIPALLGRAASVLSASGVIVWMASENRDELYAAASSGYDARLFQRIGTIRRDASNLTAAAFRDGAPRTSTRGASSFAAFAVPLLTPQGPVGVFSAEIGEVAEVGSDRLAVATIFAAQLANLLGSIATTSEAAPPAQQAQA